MREFYIFNHTTVAAYYHQFKREIFVQFYNELDTYIRSLREPEDSGGWCPEKGIKLKVLRVL